jgi:hypothetical protein
MLNLWLLERVYYVTALVLKAPAAKTEVYKKIHYLCSSVHVIVMFIGSTWPRPTATMDDSYVRQ